MSVDKSRRKLLVGLMGVPLFVIGKRLSRSSFAANYLVRKRIDIEEYANTLENYCDTWPQGTTSKVIDEIRQHTHLLESSTFNGSQSEKKRTIEVLCGYQMLIADVASEQILGGSSQILTQTIRLSTEEKLYNTCAYALRQKAGASIDTFEQTRDYSVLKQATADLQAAEVIQSQVSPFYQAMVDIRRGLVYACVAGDAHDFTNALNIIDDASKQIGRQSDDRRIAARLDEERYRLNRASAYLYSLRGSPQLALLELYQAVEAWPHPSPRRRVHRDVLFAETFMELGDYPMAVAHAASAVEISSANAMNMLFNRMENVYRALRSSRYGKASDVARLGAQILKARYPELLD